MVSVLTYLINLFGIIKFFFADFFEYPTYFTDLRDGSKLT